MKTFVSSALQVHMASPAATLAWNLIIMRSDGRAFGFTTDVEGAYVVTLIAGVPPILGQPAGSVWCDFSPSFNPTDIATSGSLSQNNMDIEALLDELGITEDDVRARLWQAARVELCVTNFMDASQGTDTVFMGTLGGATGGDLSVKFELRGLTQPLEANLDGVSGPMCRVRLGSVGPGMCNVDLTPYRRTGTIAGAVADRLFVDPARTEPDDWWTKGELTVTSGASMGVVIEIKHSLADGTIELVEELYRGFADGDTYEATPGCNKLLKITLSDGTISYTGDCKTKFDNVVNMQAEPELPGQIAIQQYGGQTVA